MATGRWGKGCASGSPARWSDRSHAHPEPSFPCDRERAAGNPAPGTATVVAGGRSTSSDCVLASEGTARSPRVSLGRNITKHGMKSQLVPTQNTWLPTTGCGGEQGCCEVASGVVSWTKHCSSYGGSQLKNAGKRSL